MKPILVIQSPPSRCLNNFRRMGVYLNTAFSRHAQPDGILHNMLHRMQEQKRAVTIYSRDFGHFTCRSVEEWDLDEKLINTLEPTEITFEITLRKTKHNSPTRRFPRSESLKKPCWHVCWIPPQEDAEK